MQKYRVLKDVRVESGPPFTLLKGSTVLLHAVSGRPVLGHIFMDRETYEEINEKWKEYLEETK